MARNPMRHHAAHALPLLACLALAALPTSRAFADPGLVCGAPKRNGEVTLSLTIGKNGDTRVMKIRTTLINIGSAEEKATQVALILDNFTPHSKDSVSVASNGATVTPTPHDGWHVIGIHLERDSTYEDDQVLSSAAPGTDRAVLSLAGTATGHALSGGQGFVQVVAFGRNAQVATQPGMTSQMVEQLVMQQLGAQGLEVRPAAPADFNGYDLDHDASVIFIGPGNTLAAAGAASGATTVGNVAWMVNDPGLVLDLGGMMYPAAMSAGVGRLAEGPRLDVMPTLMHGGPVRVAFAAGGAPVRLTALDAMGRHVRTLYAGRTAGETVVRWDGGDARGRTAPSGVYYLRLETPAGVCVRRVTRVE